MNIVIDTNIIRSDFLFKSSDYKIILDYLTKTDSKLILPLIVYEEIEGLYKRTLSERIEEYNKSTRILNSGMIDPKQFLDLSTVNYDDEANKYLDYLKKKFHLQDKDIVKYRSEYLQEIIKRAINRIKPCSASGQEFRDTLLWLSLIEIAKNNSTKQLVFISNNVKDFADSTGDNLHPTLIEDLSKNKVNIIYFKSIKDFIKNQAVKIDFITEEWLERNLDLEKISEQVVDIIGRNDERYILKALDEYDKTPTGDFDLTGYCSLWVNYFYIYEMGDGTLSVELVLNGELEVEYVYEAEVEKEDYDWDYEYHYNPITRDMDYEPVFGRKMRRSRGRKMDTKLLEVTAYLSIEVKKKKIVNYEITDCEV